MTEEKLDEPYRPVFVDAEADLVRMKTGHCPWCHASLAIDPQLEQQVCPACDARIATQSALESTPQVPAVRGRASPARLERPDPVTLVGLLGAGGFLTLAIVLMSQGAVALALAPMVVVVAIFVALKDRP